MAEKRTLKAAVDAGAEGVMVFCISCPNSKEFTAEHALELWGTQATFPEIARRSKCGRCRQQASEAAPQWPHQDGIISAPRVIPAEWDGLDTRNPARFDRRA